MPKEPLHVSVRQWIAAMAPALAVFVALGLGIWSAEKTRESIKLLRHSIRLQVESQNRPYLSVTFDRVYDDGANALIRYFIKNTGNTPAFSVRPTVRIGDRYDSIPFSWKDSSAFEMIPPRGETSFETRIIEYWEFPVPRYLHFLCTYEYKYPVLSDSMPSDTTIGFVLLSTLVDPGGTLKGLGFSEVRKGNPPFTSVAYYRHPDYYVY